MRNCTSSYDCGQRSKHDYCRVCRGRAWRSRVLAVSLFGFEKRQSDRIRGTRRLNKRFRNRRRRKFALIAHPATAGRLVLQSLRKRRRPLQQPDALRPGFFRRRSFPKWHQWPCFRNRPLILLGYFLMTLGTFPEFRADLLAFAFAELETLAR